MRSPSRTRSSPIPTSRRCASGSRPGEVRHPRRRCVRPAGEPRRSTRGDRAAATRSWSIRSLPRCGPDEVSARHRGARTTCPASPTRSRRVSPMIRLRRSVTISHGRRSSSPSNASAARRADRRPTRWPARRRARAMRSTVAGRRVEHPHPTPAARRGVTADTDAPSTESARSDAHRVGHRPRPPRTCSSGTRNSSAASRGRPPASRRGGGARRSRPRAASGAAALDRESSGPAGLGRSAGSDRDR